MVHQRSGLEGVEQGGCWVRCIKPKRLYSSPEAVKFIDDVVINVKNYDNRIDILAKESRMKEAIRDFTGFYDDFFEQCKDTVAKFLTLQE